MGKTIPMAGLILLFDEEVIAARLEAALQP
jgi:hypothetical protein